jgi:hypothetical protein
MPLSTIISLSLNHIFSLETVNHSHLEASSLDFGLVYLRGLFLGCQDGLLHLLGVLQGLQLVFAVGDLLKVVLNEGSFLGQAVGEGGGCFEGANQVVSLTDLSLFSLQ